MSSMVKLFILLLLVFSVGAQADEMAKIGVLIPFSGDVAAIGAKLRNGFVIAEEQHKGEVKIVYEDVGGLAPALAVRAASKLLDVDKVSVIVGPYGPEQSIIVSPLAAKRDVVLVAFTLCGEALKNLSNVFCGYPAVVEQIAAMSPHLKARKLTSLALVAEESSFGAEAASRTVELATGLGIKVTLSEVVPSNERDFKALVARIRVKKPDGIFVAMADPAQAFLLFKQLWDAKYSGERFAFIDYDDKYLQEFGSMTEGILVPGAYTGKINSSFAEAFRKRFHSDPDLYAAEAYDLLSTTIQALKDNNGSKHGLADRLAAQNFSDTAIPGFRFRTDRTVSFPMGVLVAQGGKFIPAQGEQ